MAGGSEAAMAGPTVVAAIAMLAAATTMRRHTDVSIKAPPKNQIHRHCAEVNGMIRKR
jgi:hypothetical protein